MQRVSRCPRAASARGPKAVSQPSSLCSGNCLFVGSESCRAGWTIGGSNSRSPLIVRLTEMGITAALSAVTGVTGMLMPPAIRALKRQAEVIFLSQSLNLRRIEYLRRHSTLVVSKRNSVQYKQPDKYGRQPYTEQFCSHAVVHRRVLSSSLGGRALLDEGVRTKKRTCKPDWVG